MKLTEETPVWRRGKIITIITSERDVSFWDWIRAKTIWARPESQELTDKERFYILTWPILFGIIVALLFFR